MTLLDRAALEEARNAASEIDGIRRMVTSIALSALENHQHSLSALERIGDHCRELGAHEEAAKVYNRVMCLDPQNAKAASLQRVLTGVVRDRMEAEKGPAPFYQIRNFLSDELHNALLTQAISDLDFFGNAVVYDSRGEKFENSLGRRGKVLTYKKIEPFRKLFLPELKRALQTSSVLERLGVITGPDSRYEVQVTNYSDNEYFGRHVDDGFHNPKRKVSYVYYMSRHPGCFIGGDLLLHDHRSSPDEASSFTRVLPIDNSIVFFRSSSQHEVLPTFVSSNDRRDGRFSVNGWVVQADEEA